MSEPEFPPQEELEKLLATAPHDSFFKLVFARPERAAALFQRHLPPGTAAVIDWSTLTAEPASFIKTSLHRRQSDLLFSAQSSHGGRQVFFHILFEHQSTVDPAMPLRLLAYMVEIWTHFAETHPGEPLPVVVPFLLHQGPDRWTVSPQFVRQFGLPEDLEAELRRYVPDFTHVLLDLTQRDPANEEEHPELQTVLLLMKMARERDDMTRFLRWLLEQTAPLAEHLLRACLTYSLHADTDLDFGLMDGILGKHPKLKEPVMSTAMKLIAQGEARGIWIGKLQNLQEMMNLPVTDKEDLQDHDVAALKSLFHALQREYNERFKG